jgi:mycothiol synthase
VEFIRSGPETAEVGFTAEFRGIAAAAEAADGYQPFNEQTLLDVSTGRRTPVLLSEEGSYVGALVTGGGELDLVVRPNARRHGYGGVTLATILADTPGELTAWSHGDHPGARALAARFGFSAERTLLQLRRPLHTHGAGTFASPTTTKTTADGARAPEIEIAAFRPGFDDAEWVALNALVFAHHPEQGALTLADLAARQAESWFDAGDFLLARDSGTGRVLGYNWLKVEAGSSVGEIYVVGVHADAAGHGLGRRLMLAGLDRLRARGCATAALYVEADSIGPVRLYRSLGFTDHTVDVQYRLHTG